MIVVFDLFNVVVSWSSSKIVPRWAEEAGMSAEEFREATGEFFDACERGTMSMEQMWVQIGKATKTDSQKMRALFLEQFDKHASLNEDVVKVAESCKQKVILSNQFPLHAKEVSTRGWVGMFDKVFVSFELGARKPEQVIYEKTASMVGAKSGQLILIDDKQENVNAARVAGWHAIKFENATQLKEELEQYEH